MPWTPGCKSGAWPWPGLQVDGLTSRPLLKSVPAGVVAGGHRPGGLLAQLRTAAPAGDAFLFGGRRTPEAFMVLGAIEMLEVLQFPALLAEGVPFSPPDSPQRHLRLEQQHTFPDGTSHHAYVVATEPTTRT